MNRDSTDNRDTSVQNLRDEQYSHANNQQVENSRLNQINTVVNVIDKGTKTSMTPTPLYILFFLFQSLLYTYVFIREYSYWSRNPVATATSAFAVFTSIVMIVGVLTVCFTSSRSTSKYIFVFFIYKSFF